MTSTRLRTVLLGLGWGAAFGTLFVLGLLIRSAS